MQIIFQDPFSSLDPRMKVSDIIGEPLVIHNMAGSRAEYRDQTAELLRVVGLDPSMGDRYPHEFSGGQRQRIGVARALAVKPSFIVCDEPVSALDVSIQAQIINLLEDLQEQFNLTYLFIAHDLAVVRHISDRIAVMYLGNSWRSPPGWNSIIIRSIPIPGPCFPPCRSPIPTVEAKREHIILKGEVPSPLNPAAGLPFSSPLRIVHRRFVPNRSPRKRRSLPVIPSPVISTRSV